MKAYVYEWLNFQMWLLLHCGGDVNHAFMHLLTMFQEMKALALI
jgi:hypothetical protein